MGAAVVALGLVALCGCGDLGDDETATTTSPREPTVTASTVTTSTTAPPTETTEGDEPGGCEGCNATVAPVGCSANAVHLAIEANIDGGIRVAGEPRCTDTHLVVDIDTGSSGCPPTEGEPSPCANVKTAFFEARDGAWQVVTYGAGETCASVAAATGIEFPDEVCA
jgi:hypothetical protein